MWMIFYKYKIINNYKKNNYICNNYNIMIHMAGWFNKTNLTKTNSFWENVPFDSSNVRGVFKGALGGSYSVGPVRWRLNVSKKIYGPICQIDDVISFQKSAHKIFSTHLVATGPGDLEPPRDPLNTPWILARSNGTFFQNELVLVKFYLRDHPAIF